VASQRLLMVALNHIILGLLLLIYFMSVNIQEGQKGSVIRMLQLKTGDSHESGSASALAPQWKVLIYDRACQEIIAPILKVRYYFHLEY
jgi:hypothetical protein